MKKIIFLFLTAIVFLQLLESCKKYPDGPSVTIYTKKHRLCRIWKIRSAVIEGVDSSSYYTTSLEFQKSGDNTYVWWHNTVNSWDVPGRWTFNSNKTTIDFSADTHDFFRNEHTYSILRLTSDNLWLSCVVNNQTCQFKFVAEN